MSPLVRAALAAALLPFAVPAQDPAPPQDPAPAMQPVAVQNPFKPFDRAAFENACKTLGATDAQLQAFGSRAGEVGVPRAADDLLRQLVPAFDAAVKLHEGSDPQAAVALTKVLAGAQQPLLRAHVRYHLARLFLDSDDPERAVQILNEYLEQDLNQSALDPEAAFFYAQALADMPLPEHALPRFRAFLQWFPDASERFRSAASQRIGEIERQQESQLHGLADGMKKSERELKKQRTGKPTQIEQEKLVAKLQELIEMYQERESQSGGPPSGNKASSGPATESGLPEGDGSVGNLEKRHQLADRWGDMKDVDREKIAAQVDKGLPPGYRKMLEEYYKKLGKAGTRQ